MLLQCSLCCIFFTLCSCTITTVRECYSSQSLLGSFLALFTNILDTY